MSLNLMKVIPEGKIIIAAFSLGESSAYMLKLLKEKYGNTHRIIVCCCNTGEEDEESFIFGQKIEEYLGMKIILLEYRRKKTRETFFGKIVPMGDYQRVSWETAYRKTEEEKRNGYPNHPFRFWIEDYGFPQYPNRTCTREMKERTIDRYLSSIGVMPKDRVNCPGIRWDEISNRNPDPKKYYELIVSRVTKPIINNFFENEMPFRLEIPSWLGNCGACISKSVRNLCTIARHRPEKFDFFDYISKEYGVENHTYYRERNTIESIFEKSKDETIKDGKDNRFDFSIQTYLDIENFDVDLDSEGACGGTCEPFT